MEVLLGPNFGIDVRDRSGVVPVAADQHTVASCLFLEDDITCTRNGPGSVFGIGSRGKAPEQNEESSDSSSSIGAPDDSEDEEDNDEVSSKEVQSHFNGTGLGSLGSMEDSLPIKRGLSNHFTGKSKSFANLLEVSAVKDLEKTENPFNKRRRVLVSAKWSSRRSSFYSSSNPKSMPLLALNEEEDEDEDGHHQQQLEYTSSSSQSSSSTENKEQEKQERVPRKYIDKRLLSFKSRSCFSLSDLQEHDEQDED
ncbi:uncharacterized G-patch domain protein DDB_G0278987-like [Juglans microcarpa x Juglans regia]|uniref:uncharacterized G-patch domain protein DDB_G0278987-like n=1 Tax=Juglans microcarpa x Juglans regia TaxID=2249226 RepID=UPI001B7E0EFE|nr:uncharacterized G-patch domain protein DDB_G0278987-like [Juglans microcarpa x Juglans regia]